MPLAKEYVESPQVTASVLAVICNDLLTEDFLNYEVETVVDSLQSLLGATIPEENIDKIQALQTIFTTNLFYMQVPAFMAIVDALSGDGVDFDYADMPHVEDVAWAVIEVLMLVPDEDFENLFSPDVAGFIKTLLKEEGFHTPPPSLNFIGELESPDIRDTILEDITIHEAYYGIQKEKMDAVEEYVAENIRKTMIAINELPLANRDEKSWKKFISSVS